MWCSVCQSDVATEVGADNRRVNCSNCGHLLGGVSGASTEQNSATTGRSTSSSGPDTRAEEARQLLDRWAKGHFFDPYGPPKKTGTGTDSGIAAHSNDERTGIADRRPSTAVDRPAARPAPDSNFEENRNRETVDERDFLPDSRKPEPQAESRMATSNSGANFEAEESEPLGAALDKRTPGSAARPERQVADSSLAAKTSSDELDRLTREIMDRVSRITEAREAANVEASRSRNSRPDSLSELSPSKETADSHSVVMSAATVDDADQEGSMADDPQPRPARIAAFDQPTSIRSGSSVRTDPTHQSISEPTVQRAAPSTAPAATRPAPGGWYNNVGQMLAYMGIIFLTAGTCGVIVSYFGGPANYAPYGWLGATIGQMLLFLGIVTLISAGMEQTSQELRQAVDQRMDEVTQRLDLIGSRIMRIEKADLDGPPRPHLLSPAEPERRRTERTAARSAGSND